MPTGDVKLVIDGRTATNAPAGDYFPEMVMDLTIQPGLANTVMGSMGTHDETGGELPTVRRLPAAGPDVILQTVSNTQPTTIGVTGPSRSGPDAPAAADPDAHRAAEQR